MNITEKSDNSGFKVKYFLVNDGIFKTVISIMFYAWKLTKYLDQRDSETRAFYGVTHWA